jgi:hypothetical protein
VLSRERGEGPGHHPHGGLVALPDDQEVGA